MRRQEAAIAIALVLCFALRAFQGDGVRVTIGTPAENDQFLAAAEAALEQTA